MQFWRPLLRSKPRSGRRLIGADLFDNPNVAKRNLLKGPGAWGVNLGLDKSFRLERAVSFAIRRGVQQRLQSSASTTKR